MLTGPSRRETDPFMSVRILIADDHPLTVAGMRQVLGEAGFELVGVVDEEGQIDSIVKNLRPDVVVTEARLGGRDALRVIESIRQEQPGCRVVVFTVQQNPCYLARAAAIGCSEFVSKSDPPATLIDAIRNAAQQEPPNDGGVLSEIGRKMRRRPGRAPSDSPLTRRETQVLSHVARGLSNREIGLSLSISVETVKEHVQNILRKLDVNDRTQAAVWALQRGFLENESPRSRD